MTEKNKEEEPKKTADKPKKSEYFKDKTESEFINWLEKQVREAPVVKVHHGKWKELMEWKEGNQFSAYDSAKRSVQPVELKRRKKRVIVNLMKPLVQTIAGKLDLGFRIIGIPNSASADDIFASYVSTRLVDHNNNVNDMEEMQEEVKEDLLGPGIACRKWFWDKNTNGVMKDGKSGFRDIPGELVGEVIPVFNVRPDPVAKTPEKMRWIIEIKEISADELIEVFGLKEAEVDALAEKQGKGTIYEGMNENEDEKDPDEATFILKMFWQKPGWRYPKGRLVQTVGDKVLYFGPNPCPDYELPYFFFSYDKTKYSFWPKGPLHYIQDIQREFNRTVSLISEHVESWRPKMAVGQGALKRANSLTVDSFEILEVDFSRGEPRAVQMPQLSSSVPEYRDWLVGSVDRVSNVHEVSYARLPQYASRAPASLYEMMLEQENIKLGPMIRMMNKELVRETRFRLKYMAKKYTTKRMIRIIGPNRKATVEWFKGADVKGNYDVRLEEGVSINQSQSVMTRLMLELWQQGVLEGRDKFKILRILDLGTAEYDLRSDAVDMERAIRENHFFSEGEGDKPDVYIHDDHETHLDQHTNLRKSEEFESWPKEKQEALDNHAWTHFWMFMQLQQIAKGGQAPEQAPMMPGAAPPGAEGGGAAGRPPTEEIESQPGAGAGAAF